MNPKEFYKHYVADDELSLLSYALRDNILKDKTIQHVLDFGCGTGKHLNIFNRIGINTIGLDISMQNILIAKYKHNLPCVICADETYLRSFANIDVVMTCSVLNHFVDVKEIIGEFQRIANKSVYLAETTDLVGKFYYKHNYEQYGFKKVKGLQIDQTNEGFIYIEDPEAFSWKSPDNGATYHIYSWFKT